MRLYFVFPKTSSRRLFGGQEMSVSSEFLANVLIFGQTSRYIIIYITTAARCTRVTSNLGRNKDKRAAAGLKALDSYARAYASDNAYTFGTA